MTILNKRTCSEVRGETSAVSYNPQRIPIENFRDCHAYVLLGAPGSGKTEVFKYETQISNSCHYETARNFIRYDGIKSEWQNKVLFIDGLDEVRAGILDGRTSIDAICAKLEKLNCPKFRISCRATDWYGANDRSALNELTHGGSVDVLYLDSLTNEHIWEILDHNPCVRSVDEFIKLAREREVDSLLHNPQSLNLLIQSVNENQWPKSRSKVFEIACKTLIAEYNDEHQRALPLKLNLDRLLDEAGKICAYLLLTGKIGFKLIGEIGTTEYIAVNDIQDVDPDICLRIMKSGLFDITMEEHVAPIHMNIAEYLAGRYLGKLIDEFGLPIKRFLSLIVGIDGGLVSKFQNLAAWISSFSNSGRSELISRDPLGTILYGDCSKFFVEHKIHLLKGLREQANKNPWFFVASRVDFRLSALLTHDMVDYFHLTLRKFNTSTNDMKQASFVKTILNILTSSRKMPGIADELVRILWKDDCPSGLKELALIAYMIHGDSDTIFIELKRLLNEINSGEVHDPDDSLLGWLLQKLYPYHISSSDLLNYYHPRKKPNFYGSYHMFWWSYIPKHSKYCQFTQIIDNFKNLINDPINELNDDQLSFWKYTIRVYYQLVYQFILLHPERVKPENLLCWIFGLRNKNSFAIGGKEIYIKNYLVEKPNLLKKILNLRINYCEQKHKHDPDDDFDNCMIFSINRLTSPYSRAHLVEWYLDQAITSTSKNVATFFIKKVAACILSNDNSTNVPQKSVLNKLKSHPKIQYKITTELLNHLKQISQQNENNDNDIDEELKLRKREWYKFFKPHEIHLQNSECPASILNKLSLVYFRQVIDVVGETPLERLDYLLGDKSLVEAALLGLEKSIYRNDVPDAKEILRMSANNTIHLLAYPILASLDILVEKPSSMKDTFSNDEYLRKVLTLILSTPILPNDKKMKWLTSLLECSPKIFREILTQVFSFQLTKGMIPIFNLEELVRSISIDKSSSTFHRDEITIITGQVSLSLLQSFGVRSRSNHLPYLISLLKSASLHAEPEQLAQLIDKKLSRKSMHPGQRIYWLAGSLWVSGNKYLNELENYIAVSERRLAHLTRFLDSDFWPPLLTKKLKSHSLQFYITLFGPEYRPININGNFAVMNIPDRIHLFIEQLALMKSTVACHTLEELSKKDDLNHWHPHLLNAFDKQKKIQREHQFKYCSIDQITNTLQNKSPSNSADLFALIEDKLLEIGKKIRRGNTSEWRAYWELKSKKPVNPQHEDVCRDRLLFALQFKLHELGVDPQPEGHYADDKRADIRVQYGKINIPIEIKKNCSKDLWTAIHGQLIPKYTRDPGADGYGIYLVLWFGIDCCKQQKSISHISTAEELQQRLKESLSKNERKKISVCVIDVAKPN